MADADIRVWVQTQKRYGIIVSLADDVVGIKFQNDEVIEVPYSEIKGKEDDE